MLFSLIEDCCCVPVHTLQYTIDVLGGSARFVIRIAWPTHVISSKNNSLQSNHKNPGHHNLCVTPFVSNCRSFDLFNSKFDHSSYSKICAKYHFFYCGLLCQFSNNNLNLTMFAQIFWIRRVIKLSIKKVKRSIIWNGESTYKIVIFSTS